MFLRSLLVAAGMMPAAPSSTLPPELQALVTSLDHASTAPAATAGWDDLAQVDLFALGGIGAAGVTSSGETLTRRLASLPDAADQLDRIARMGTPAARLYAYWALSAIAPARAAAHLGALRADRTEVRTMRGCMLMSATVAEEAADLVRRGPPRLTP